MKASVAAQSNPPATAREPGGPAVGRLLFAVMFGAFTSMGLLDGGGGVLWPDVTDAFNVSDGMFGLASGLGLLIAFPIMMLAGRIADRFDKRSLLLVAFLGLTLTAASLASAGNALLLVGILVIRGFSVSLIDIGNNAIAIDYERSSGRHILGPLHAMYSGGALIGALGVWGIFALGGSYRTVYFTFAGLFLLLALLAWRARSRPGPPDVRTEPVSITATLHLLRNRDIRLLGAITALSMFGAILVSQWAGIYLRDERDAGETVRVLAVALYGGLMFVGRAFNGPVVQLLGVRWTLVGQGALAAIGGLMISAGGPLWLAVLGCGLAGLGLAGLIPLALSIGGVLFPRESASVSGAVLLIGYVGLAAAPFLAGLVATLISARVVMALTAVAGLLVVTIAFRLRATRMVHGADHPTT
jgi:MFS family permease